MNLHRTVSYGLPLASVLLITIAFVVLTRPDVTGLATLDVAERLEANELIDADITVALDSSMLYPVDSEMVISYGEEQVSVPLLEFINLSGMDYDIAECRIEMLAYDGSCVRGRSYKINLSQTAIDRHVKDEAAIAIELVILNRSVSSDAKNVSLSRN